MMAVRSPSSFTILDYDEYTVEAPVLSSSWDSVYDNMEFALDAEIMSVGDCFYQWLTTNTSTLQEVYRYYMVFRDDCGTFQDGTTHTLDIALRIWSSGVNIDWQIGVNDASDVAVDTATGTITGSTTPTWYGLSASFEVDCETNGDENYVFVKIKAATAGTVYCGGIMVVDK
jgi:hypothetical protein